MPIRVPKWIAVLPRDSERVGEAFRALLGELDVTQRKLATRMDRSPQTVNHWATGRTRPPLEAMHESVEALDTIAANLKERVDQMSEILADVDACLAEHDRLGEEKSEAARDAYSAATQRLDAALTEAERG